MPPPIPVPADPRPMLITSVERVAASAALGYTLGELEPCAECGQLMRRYGRNAAMHCGVCRAALCGR
jgi:hypothetical protein